MAADFTISQSGGAGAGTLNTELLQVWGGIAVQLVAEPAASYAWSVLDRPNGTAAAPAAPTSGSTTITPEVVAGRWRIQLTTPGGTRVLVFEVTKNGSGAALDNGLGVTPAHLERPSEAGGRGAARVFERFRASLLSLISALPLADKLLMRDNAGAAAATSFTGASTHDAKLVAATGRKVLIHGFEGARVRVEGPDVCVDGWDSGIPDYAHCGTLSPIFGGGLYMSNAAGTTEIVAGASDITLSASGQVNVTASSTMSRTVNGLTCTESNESGTFRMAVAAPMRIQPQQQTSGAGRALTIGGGAGQTPGTHAQGDVRILLGDQAGGQTARLFLTDETGADTDFIRVRRIGSAAYFESIAGSINHTSTGELNFEATTNVVFRGTSVFYDANTKFHRTTALSSKMTETVADAYVYNWAASVTSVKWQNNGTTRFELDDNGIGFLGATPVARPTVTGSRGGNAALASLLTALANLGLITDSSTP